LERPASRLQKVVIEPHPLAKEVPLLSPIHHDLADDELDTALCWPMGGGFLRGSFLCLFTMSPPGATPNKIPATMATTIRRKGRRAADAEEVV